MEATEKNFRIADEILSILAKENCTARQATEVLHYAMTKISDESTVQYVQGSLIDMINGVD